VGAGDVSDVAQVLVSELVTNAVLHAEPPIELGIDLRGGRVRITVVDGSPTIPEPQDPDQSATSGRGLLLVDALSASWGWQLADRGKCVWFEL
jgi:anti-sigma regulatory factor (Ser/Thr protein kinase)